MGGGVVPDVAGLEDQDPGVGVADRPGRQVVVGAGERPGEQAGGLDVAVGDAGPDPGRDLQLLDQVLLGPVPVLGWAQGPDHGVAAGGQERAQPVDAAQLGDRVPDDPERGLVRDTQAAGGGLGDREQLPGR